MTASSSAAPTHEDEWLKDYQSRLMAAVHKRPKPEGEDEPEGESVILFTVPK